MHWAVAASFFDTTQGRWLDDFVPGEQHHFTKIANGITERSWHGRASRGTPFAQWMPYIDQARRAYAAEADGVITVFPQLATIAGLRKRLPAGKRKPVVAWCYNVGLLQQGVRQRLARLAMHDIDRIVVHSTEEVKTVSEWLGLPEERVLFTPLQCGALPIEVQEDMEKPFLLAMGSANRDYATLFAALEKIDIPTIIVASEHSLAGLAPPPCVTVLSNISMPECRRLAQRARVNIVPLKATPTASGQITVLEAMRMYRPVVTTRCVGTIDYVDDGRTGVLVEPNDVPGLATTLEALWHDAPARAALASQAGIKAEQDFSDEAVGRQLGKLLDEVEHHPL